MAVDRQTSEFSFGQSFNTHNKDLTKSVIYGTDPSAVLDSDKFSEISLDQPVDSELTTTQQEYNPLQNLDTFSPLTSDEQLRQQQQLQNQRDELLFNPLAQAAAIKDSLSQLPGVASSVLSSFSSILKGRTSPYLAGEELHAPSAPPSSASPYPTQLPGGETEGQVNTTSVNPFPSYYSQSIQEQTPDVPPVAPTFYSPTDPLILRPEASLSPPSTCGESSSNLYRLKERKKLYAPIPGLNANNSLNPTPLGQIQSNQIPPIPPSVPSVPETNPIPTQAANQNASFSISSFFNGASLLDKVLPKPSNPTADIGSAGGNCSQPIGQPMYIDHPAQAPSTAAFEPFTISSHQSNTSQATAPFGITTPPSQIHPVSPGPSIPPPALTNTFKLNPFESAPAQNQVAATATATSPPTSTAHLFNIGASPPHPPPPQPVNCETPPAPQFFNPNSTPQPANAPSFYPPPSLPSVPVSTNPNLFQAPSNPTSTAYHPSASPGPAIVQQTPIPSNYLPQSVPPSGQVTSYRLQGKPHYKKPIQSTQFPNQSVNPQPTQFFTPPTSVQPSVPISNFHIFNPLAFDNSQQQEIHTPASIPAPAPTPPSAQIQPSFAQTSYPTVSGSGPLQPPPLLPPSISTPINDSVNLYRRTPVDSGVTAAPPNPCTSFIQTPPKTDESNSYLPPQSFDSSSLTNIFQPAAFNINRLAVEPLPKPPTPTPAPAPVQLEPVCQPVETKQLSETQQSSASEQPSLFSADNSAPTVKHPTIQNFFEPSTTFDPFQVTQNNLILDNTKKALDSENKNLENINSGVQNLALDSENNFVQDSVVTTNTFDPASFFSNNSNTNNNNNNNNNNSNIINDSSCNDSASDQCVKSVASNPNEFQNFFNDPPPLSDLQENVQENNFNFIRTNLLNKRIERIANAETASPETLSVASVIAEPGSSAPSERSFADPPSVADGSVQPLPTTFENNPDQADGINIYTWLNKQESAEMAAAPSVQTSPTATTTSTNIAYRPVYKHWFYKTTSEAKRIWIPFSFSDSMLLESALAQGTKIVTTDGGRFDVNIEERTRTPAYWVGESNEVRRCSWFYKGKDFRLIPYEEDVAEQLEEEYKDAAHTGEWHRKIPLTSGETVTFSGPSDILHFLKSESTEEFNNAMQNSEVRPRAVKRGTDEFAIEDGEPEQIDHLLFMVHGIGSACDLKFRKVEEVVDEFRSIALQLVQSHYRSSCDRNIVGRVEVLPISWHSELHSEESGIDEKLRSITLESIPKLRNFTNDTLLDILFYTSPVFCQQIIDAVSGNLNKCYAKFCERNPSFHGSVSVSGHSLGSLILFDLLQHQRIEVENSENLETADRTKPPLKRHCSQQINYTIGNAGTGQPYISYPQLSFQPKHFFALGSPIGMFVTVRGIDALGLDFKLPTTEHFFNIFHPYDPVAYRIEALVNPELQMRPVLVPHHKGRKRMHLELRETVARVGADIKQKILHTLRSTIDTVYSYTTLHKPGPNDAKAIQQEVNKVIDEQLTLDELEVSGNTSSASSEIDTGETDLALGKINGGRRIDYVLQEAPLEIINEYLFALTSHVCYWGSEDATLFIMKEIYSSLGVQADTKIPQPTMTIERPSPATSAKLSPTS